jgi:hypothetical protein
MRRKLFTAASAISLLLSAATAVLCVASYRRAWEIKTKGPTGPNGGIVNAIELGLDARSADGTLLIKYNICVWDVPYWKLVTVLLYFGARSWVPWHVFAIRQRRGENECATCGYNLTGNTSGVCPECGTPVAQKAEATV